MFNLLFCHFVVLNLQSHPNPAKHAVAKCTFQNAPSALTSTTFNSVFQDLAWPKQPVFFVGCVLAGRF